MTPRHKADAKIAPRGVCVGGSWPMTRDDLRDGNLPGHHGRIRIAGHAAISPEVNWWHRGGVNQAHHVFIERRRFSRPETCSRAVAISHAICVTHNLEAPQ